MPFTRRQVAFSGAVLLSAFAGCSDLLDDEPTLREVHLDLLNRTDDPRTFHFVLESNDGLGQWHDFMLDAGVDDQVVVEPASDREWVGYHAVAGDEQISGTLLGQGDEYTCLELGYTIEEDQIVGTLSTARTSCRS